jgi:hypothetical protein
MNIKPNIGMLNALIRITIGLTILSWTTAKLVKRPWRDSYLFIAMCAAMKVAEGIVRYCPVTALFERYQEMMPEKENHASNESSENLDIDIPYNPT